MDFMEGPGVNQQFAREIPPVVDRFQRETLGVFEVFYIYVNVYPSVALKRLKLCIVCLLVAIIFGTF